MIDHLGLRVRDADIGYVGVGLGRDGKPDFWTGNNLEAVCQRAG